MKRMRRGLLMILITALVVPAPAVGASALPAAEGAPPPVSIANPDPTNSPAITVNQSSAAATSTSPAPKPSPPSLVPTSPPAVPAPPSPHPQPSTPSASPTAARLVISKLNPDEPESIELFNPDAQPVELRGVRIEFMPQGGKMPVVLKEFRAGQVPAGGFVTIGDVSGVSFDTATKNAISLHGTLRIVLDDYEEELTFGDGSALSVAHRPRGQRFIQRCHATEAEFVVTAFDVTRFGTWPNCQQEPPSNMCSGVRLSEIGVQTGEQFIELHNTSTQAVNLADCRVTTQRARAPYVLPDRQLAAGEFFRVMMSEAKWSLTKTGGVVYFLTSAGEEIDEVAYEKLAKGTSWALVDGQWHQTYAPTPGQANIFQRWRTCEPGTQINEATGNCVKIPSPEPPACAPGYYRHPETGRCRKIVAAKAPAPCKEGQYRSEATGRCRSIAAIAAKELKPCKDGYFRNPTTGRCKKIAADSEVLKECPEGFERNPKTNRCRKIKALSPPAVAFKPESVQQVAGAAWGWWVFGGVGLLALGYAGWQWRWELGQLVRRVGSAFTSGKK